MAQHRWRGCRLTASLSHLTSHVQSIKHCYPSVLFSRTIFFKHEQQICLLAPTTWMYFDMQTSTMNVNCLDQHHWNCEAFGLLLHGLPRMLRPASPHLSAAAVQPGTACPLHSQAKTLSLAMARECVPACIAPRKMKPNPAALLQSEKEVSGVVLCFILCWQGTQGVYSCLLRNSTDYSPC